MSQTKYVNVGLIKDTRLNKNISTEQMSQLMGYKGGNAYFRKENGDRKFSVEDVTKISRILELPIQDIFFNMRVTESETCDKQAI